MANNILTTEISAAFPGSATALSDSVIEENPDLSQLGEHANLQLIVPAYMGWCSRNSHRPAELVHDYTLRSLAEFGRSKNPKIAHLSFKHTCSAEQKEVVAKFLRWCLDPALLLDRKQVERSLKRWTAH
jgi:hypothetical protein